MFIGLKELRTAPVRTGIIGVTVAMIAVLVTFLSSLAAGLSYESVSALQARVSAPVVGSSSVSSSVSDGSGSHEAPSNVDPALVMPAGGSTSLMGSHLTAEQIRSIEQVAPAVEILYATRGRKDNGAPVLYMSLPESGWDAPEGVSFDHLPVEFRPAGQLAQQPQAASVALVPEDQVSAVDEQEFTVLRGKQRWDASASYAGEQLSLSLMINMLYVISALVIGAFFMVWTMQRLRTVSIAFALGAPRRAILGDSLGQAAVILLAGITSGVAMTWTAGTFARAALPVQLNAETLLLPAVFLAASGLVGAVVSAVPIFTVSPRDALAAE